MTIRSTAIKLIVSSFVLVLLSAAIVVVFGQMRFDRTNGYSAIFSDISGLRPGEFVRVSGVEVGKVSDIELLGDGNQLRVDFGVDRDLRLYSGTTAIIRYLNLTGDRYLELQRGPTDQPMPPGWTIPVEHTEPALDLDALIGGMRPLFRALDPQKVNTIATSLVAAFQGQGGTINDILDSTAELTSSLADRDHAIGEVITNLNVVLNTAVRHRQELNQTVNHFEQLVSGLNQQATPLADATAHISDAAGTLADLLSDDRRLLQDTTNRLDIMQQPLVDGRDQLDDLVTKLPPALRIVARAGGVYGDFFNFYFCDISLRLNGLQPGGPVRTVRLYTQPSGRCTPQ